MHVNRSSMIRAMRNLVDNSLKYGGEKLSEIRVGYKESDAYHILSLGDNGVGIKDEHSASIFQAFRKHETSIGVDGSGLGLAIVKEIAENHRGKVWIENGKNGLSFNLSI